MVEVKAVDGFRMRGDCAYLLDIDEDVCGAIAQVPDEKMQGLFNVVRAHVWTRHTPKLRNADEPDTTAQGVAKHVEEQLLALKKKTLACVQG